MASNEPIHEDLVLVRRALDGDEAAATELVARLTPVIQARVARCMVRVGGERRRNMREELADLTQDGFRRLFDDDGKTLRRWRPDAGLSLERFAAMVAERGALTTLRSRRTNPWEDDPVEDLELKLQLRNGPDPEALVGTQQLMDRVVAALDEELSPLGKQMFELLFVDDLDVADVMRELAMTRDAVYAWRSRLRKLVERRMEELVSDPSTQDGTVDRTR